MGGSLVGGRASRWLLALGALAAVMSCGSDDRTGESGDGGTTTRPTLVPTSLRTVPGPWDGPISTYLDEQSVAALGDEVLVARWHQAGPVELWAGDLDAGTWRAVDTPPEGGGGPLRTTAGEDQWGFDLVSASDGSVLVAGTRCADLAIVGEEQSPCEEPGDFEVWRLAPDEAAWEKVVAIPAEEAFGSSGWPNVHVLGTVEDSLVLAAYPWQAETQPIVRADLDSGTVEVVGERPRDPNTFTYCVTGSGIVAGASFPREESTEEAFGGRELVSMMAPDGSWTYVPVSFSSVTGLDRVVCGADSVTVLVDDLDAGELRWTEIGDDGEVRREGVLASPLAFGPRIPNCTGSPSPPPQHPLWSGRAGVGFVRDFGWVAALDASGGCDVFDPGVAPFEIAIEPTFGAGPLVQTYPPEEGPVRVIGATRLADGRIAVVVERLQLPDDDAASTAEVEDPYADRVEVEVLVAE